MRARLVPIYTAAGANGGAPRRIAIGIEYDGSGFCGWQQQQAGVRSIEAELAAALSYVANHPVAVHAAGRTDAGVHALGQVAHFDTTSERTGYGWLRGSNGRLPRDIALTWVRTVDPDFHARTSAVARTYVYRILTRAARPALAFNHVCWWGSPLDTERMHDAAQQLRGEHDFSAFRASECQSKSTVRHVHHIAVTRQADLVSIEVTANAFLHHMVRNIVGALLKIGKGERPQHWLASILARRDRRHEGITAPASGLYLAAVHYSPHFGVPVTGPTCSDMIPGPSIQLSGTGA